jgi:hypothetical protein
LHPFDERIAKKLVMHQEWRTAECLH